MIYWNPEVTYTSRGTVYGIDADGKFDMELSSYIDNVRLPHRLTDTGVVELTTMPNQVLLNLQEQGVALTHSNQPEGRLGVFATACTRFSKGFFRIGESPEGDSVQFASIKSLLVDPQYQTDEAKGLIDRIPYYELERFGVACLKSIVK